MIKRLYKPALLLLSFILFFSIQLPAAYAGIPVPGDSNTEGREEASKTAYRIFQEYLKEHPEYKSINIFDLDGDGIPEMFLREQTLPDNDDVTVCLLAPDGINLSVCHLASKYMTIAYDAVNKGIVGETGGSGAAAYCILTVERQKFFAWFIGKEQVFTNGSPEFVYFLYGEPAELYGNGYVAYQSGFHVNPSGGAEPDLDFFSKYAITEEEFLQYAEWFRKCDALSTEMISGAEVQ